MKTQTAPLERNNMMLMNAPENAILYPLYTSDDRAKIWYTENAWGH
jgi:hypothetical protein